MLAQTTLLLALGAIASAQNMVGFPSSITCKKNDGTDGNVSKAQLEAAVVGPQGSMTDPSAANASSGHCVKMSGIPLYYTNAGDGGIAGLSYAYDKDTDTYTFCMAQGAPDPAPGYPSLCTEN